MGNNRIIFSYLLCITTTALIAVIEAQRNSEYTTPVPILKQINRHNEDGSYNYGYEGADGSFKIETKYPNGEVYGKYGYIDDHGKLREVEYGASRRGFEPQGNDINVPPPTLTNNNPNLTPLGPNEEDDGQYREDPSFYYKDQKYNKRPAIPASNFHLNNIEQTQPAPRAYNPPPPPPAQSQVYNNPAPVYRPPQPRTYEQPYYQAPQRNPYNNVNVPTQHHPALQNIDIYTGSYSVSYTGR